LKPEENKKDHYGEMDVSVPCKAGGRVRELGTRCGGDNHERQMKNNDLLRGRLELGGRVTGTHDGRRKTSQAPPEEIRASTEM
jgi:hypothetical protein